MKSRRSIWNYIQRPKLQNAFNKYAFVYFTLTLILYAGITALMYFSVMRALILDGSTSAEATTQVAKTIFLAMGVCWLYMFLSTLGLIFIFIRETHKVAGPLVPVKRQIQKLASGDFSGRVRLRPSDNIHDIAQDLNVLAENLEQWKKSVMGEQPQATDLQAVPEQNTVQKVVQNLKAS